MDTDGRSLLYHEIRRLGSHNEAKIIFCHVKLDIHSRPLITDFTRLKHERHSTERHGYWYILFANIRFY